MLLNGMRLRIFAASSAAETSALSDMQKAAVPIENRNAMSARLSQSAKICCKLFRISVLCIVLRL